MSRQRVSYVFQPHLVSTAPTSVSAISCSHLEVLAKAALVCYAVALELGQLLRDTAVRLNPYVMLANALSAFALNLVCPLWKFLPAALHNQPALCDIACLCHLSSSKEEASSCFIRRQYSY